MIPAGDDILYSTICKCEIVGLALQQRRKTKSHVLITNSGLAATNSLRKTNLELFFWPWTERAHFNSKRFFKNKKVIVKIRTTTKKIFKAAYDKRFEDKDSFYQRQFQFGVVCKDLWLKATQ